MFKHIYKRSRTTYQSIYIFLGASIDVGELIYGELMVNIYLHFFSKPFQKTKKIK
jgi:hypothetical protein